jgi:hypothetical protein
MIYNSPQFVLSKGHKLLPEKPPKIPQKCTFPHYVAHIKKSHLQLPAAKQGIPAVCEFPLFL